MKIIIVGYGQLLRAIINGLANTDHKIVGVFPHENILYSPFKRFWFHFITPDNDYNFLNNTKLNIISTKSVNSQKFINTVKKLDADLIITASWSEKFSKQAINAAKYGTLNIHPSLLPKYRGPNPYLQVILNNEKKTGITFHLMDENFDAGPIIHQCEIDILNNDTGGSLKLRCADKTQEIISSVLNDFKNKVQNRIIQDENYATYQNQISISDTIIDFKNETSEQIHRKSRAFSPWIECHINFRNEFFSFKNCTITDIQSDKPYGSIINKTDNSVMIVCCDKKVVEFKNLTWKRFNSKLAAKLYLKYIIKV